MADSSKPDATPFDNQVPATQQQLNGNGEDINKLTGRIGGGMDGVDVAQVTEVSRLAATSRDDPRAGAANGDAAVKPIRARKLTEPLGMEDVPEGASQLFRDRYASVLRDFHSGRPLFPTKRVATSLTEAKAVAAQFASDKPTKK